MTKIRIRFLENGKMEMDMDGFKGKACVNTAEKIYEALKKKGVDSKMEEFNPKPSMQEEEDVEYVQQKETAD